MRSRCGECGLSGVRRALGVVLALSAILGCASAMADGACSRLVSLAPSITETVYELGLGDRLVGVTRFCRYPADAENVAKVGGFLDLNVEQIVALKPTTVLALHESREALRPLITMGISVLEVDHRNLAGLKASISSVGAHCDRRERADAKLYEFSQREQLLKARLSGVPMLKALVVVGRVHEGKRLSGVYVSGRDGIYSDILSLIGSQNVSSHQTVAIPTLSPEGLVALAPEAILEIRSSDDRVVDTQELKAFWERYPKVPAIADGRFAIISDAYASIPGPRYLLLAERFARVIYPERF